MKLGYARVSTEDQNLEGQCQRLSAAGCEKLFEEKISGATRNLWRDNQDESCASIRMRICSRNNWMIVAARHVHKPLFYPRDNQDGNLIVARLGGRPGPRFRSMAARLR